jgi:alkylated DNA repair dioxygenase AlkB
MITDLFLSDQTLQPLPMDGADVSFVSRVDLGRSDLDYLDEFIQSTPWRAEDVIVWGKRFKQPRLIAWYGDSTKEYSYSGINLKPLQWTVPLLEIRERVESIAEAKFNSVLLNYYRDNRDSMGMHSDDEKELGVNPSIASVSLGANRTIIFKHKFKSEVPATRISLTSGSLLLMKGDTQKNWKHGINKEDRTIGPRVNLTFRTILDYPSDR